MSDPTAAAPVALITGGAGGIGRAICRALGAEEFRVIVGYHRSAEAARKLATSLPGTGHGAIAAGVTDSPALKEMALMIERLYGRLDVLINCAGTTRFVPHADLEGLDDKLIDMILATNVRGAVAVLRAVRPLLERSEMKGGAVVINISSTAAVSAIGSNIMYCASKAALDNLTKSLARALAPKIRVLSVSPGLVDTEFVKSLDPGWRGQQEAHTPLGRLASPEDVAQAVAVAVTRLTFSSGSILLVDGGRLLS